MKMKDRETMHQTIEIYSGSSCDYCEEDIKTCECCYNNDMFHGYKVLVKKGINGH